MLALTVAALPDRRAEITIADKMITYRFFVVYCCEFNNVMSVVMIAAFPPRPN